MNFDEMLSNFKAKACVMSVERFDGGDYGNIRIVAGNGAHCEDMLRNIGRPFVPNSPYGDYFPQDKNFEDSCFRAAFLGQTLHSYVRLPQMDLWLNITLLPLCSDRENMGYCVYSYDVTPYANAEQRASLSAGTASAVLQTCLKLRDAGKFEQKLQEVAEVTRKFCGADLCGILLTDRESASNTLLCKAFRTSDALTIDALTPDLETPLGVCMDSLTFERTKTLDKLLGDSTCAIIKDQKDLDWLAGVSSTWKQELDEAGARSLVLFPLAYNDSTLGYMLIVNFNVENAVKIKETLELTTFFIASEVSNHQLLRKLETLSAIDMLTGVKNRNSMNNLITDVVEGKLTLKAPCQVVFADLNGLKRVNDEQGHGAGDRLLKTAAAVLRAAFPETDIFRAGGDEFMLLAPGMEKGELMKRLQTLHALEEREADLHFAVGVSTVRDSGDIRMALHTADEMMYINKNEYYEKHPERRYR